MLAPRVDDVTTYWTSPPPDRSPRCREWVEQINGGWRPNKRIRSLGYHEAAEWFGVYIWEYLHIIWPAMREHSDQPMARLRRVSEE